MASLKIARPIVVLTICDVGSLVLVAFAVDGSVDGTRSLMVACRSMMPHVVGQLGVVEVRERLALALGIGRAVVR